MDPNTEDWDRLGTKLRDYQPAGQPDLDFAGFRELQHQPAPRSRRRMFVWLGFGLVVLLMGVALSYSLPEASSANAGRFIRQTQVTVAGEAAMMESDLKEFAERQKTAGSVAGHDRLQGAGTATDSPRYRSVSEDEAAGVKNGVFRASGKRVIAPAGSTPAMVNNTPTFTRDESAERNIIAISKLSWPVSDDLAAPAKDVSIQLASTSSESIKPSRNAPVFTVGTGLSSHWRGAGFLEDVDHGVYFSIGLEKSFGRFLLDGRIGYRGHGLSREVSETTGNAWSHYEEKTNEINDSGEEVEYTYLGIVDGYRGIEFSLLAAYRMNNRLTLQAGGRYALPSLAFRRTVHSSHDGNVTDQPNPFNVFLVDQPLVKLYDYGGLVGGQYQITPSLSVEAMLHVGLVDLIEDAGERQRRFNHSSSLSFGLRYRLR